MACRTSRTYEERRAVLIRHGADDLQSRRQNCLETEKKHHGGSGTAGKQLSEKIAWVENGERSIQRSGASGLTACNRTQMF